MIHTPLEKLPKISATQAQQFYPKFQKRRRKNAFSKLMISSYTPISPLGISPRKNAFQNLVISKVVRFPLWSVIECGRQIFNQMLCCVDKY
jgi:hypothetical protein